MTNLDAVAAVAGYTSPDENIPIYALMGFGLNATDAFNSENSSQIEQAAISVLMKLKIYASIKEGQFSQTFNSAEADKTIRFIYEGLKDKGVIIPDPLADDTKPVIKDATQLW